MTDHLFLDLLWGWIVLAILMFFILLKFTAPYGRHTTKNWGPLISNKLGWLVMELPVIIVFTLLFFLGNAPKSFPLILMYILFMIHYVNRIFIFPFQLRGKNKKMPAFIVALAIIFNLINGFFNGYWFGYLAPVYDNEWLTSWQFIVGILLFFSGMFINIYSDQQLILLRKDGKTGYYIPKGWLFKYISSPNLFGEIIEWIGWALLCWNLPAFAFALWTVANLVPRALDHHHWYQQYFQDYPANRKAVFPKIL